MMMPARAMLEAWLRGTHVYDRSADLFEMAVAQGLAAQETITATLRDAFMLGEPEVPEWLKTWATKLTAEEIAAIEARREAEQATLREYVDHLFDDDPTEWTATERARAAELGRRLSAVALVLRARKEAMAAETAEGEGLDETIFLPALNEAII